MRLGKTGLERHGPFSAINIHLHGNIVRMEDNVRNDDDQEEIRSSFNVSNCKKLQIKLY